jgi:hypothetical protein
MIGVNERRWGKRSLPEFITAWGKWDVGQPKLSESQANLEMSYSYQSRNVLFVGLSVNGPCIVHHDAYQTCKLFKKP